MVQYNAQDVKQLETLTKFARFVSKQFGVQIVFEAAQAKADNQRTIYLPSIIGMTPRDVAFLIRVTLHEVGHIIYTNYNMPKEAIKTEYHFRLINAVEDARIENLLMEEYDGAHDLFESLYNDFLADHKYTNKIFGFDPKTCDMYYFLGIYLHDYLLKISPKTPLYKLYGKKNANKIAKLVEKLKLEEYLSTVKLRTWEDTIEVATEVYNRFMKHVKDTSKKLDFDKVEESKKDIADALKTSHDRIKKMADDIDEAIAKIQELQKDRDNAMKERLSKLRNAEKKSSQIQHQIREKRRELKDFSRSCKKYAEASKAAEKKRKYEAQVAELENTLQDLQDQIQSMTADTKQFKKTQKKLDNTSKKINTRNSQINKQSRLYHERIRKGDRHSTMTNEEADEARQKLKDLEQDYKDSRNEVTQHTELTEVEKEYSKNEKKKEHAESNIHSEMVKGLSEIQKQVVKSNMPALKGMPGAEANDEWQDSAEAQQDFDARASADSKKVVVNGREFKIGNGREVLAMIDQSINDVKDFNVLEHFAEQATDDKLLNFNDINNTLIFDDITDTQYVEDKHIALTTMYDKTIYKENSLGDELNKIRIKNIGVIAAMKTIFKNKFRTNRRDRFKANQEEGKLDSRTFWRIAGNVDPENTRYFEKIIPKFINKNAATIVADISGSNDKLYSGYGVKIKEAALFISDSLNEVHIEHEIMGVHAPVSHEMREQNAASVYNRRSNRLEQIIYKRFESKKNNGLQNLELEASDNSDGESLRNAAKNLLKRGNKTKTIFYFTDGKPFLSDANLNILDSDLIRTLEWLKQNKIRVLAFGFNKEPKKFFKENYCHITNYGDMLNFFNKML